LEINCSAKRFSQLVGVQIENLLTSPIVRPKPTVDSQGKPTAPQANKDAAQNAKQNAKSQRTKKKRGLRGIRGFDLVDKKQQWKVKEADDGISVACCSGK